MKRSAILLLPLVLLLISPPVDAQLVAPGADNTPKVGGPVPDFAPLKDLAGKKKVLLAFFPAAFTGG